MLYVRTIDYTLMYNKIKIGLIRILKLMLSICMYNIVRDLDRKIKNLDPLFGTVMMMTMMIVIIYLNTVVI